MYAMYLSIKCLVLGWGGDDRGGHGGHGGWSGGKGGHRNESPFGQGNKSHGHRDVYYS